MAREALSKIIETENKALESIKKSREEFDLKVQNAKVFAENIIKLKIS